LEDRLALNHNWRIEAKRLENFVAAPMTVAEYQRGVVRYV
jgi:hypothetical protein